MSTENLTDEQFQSELKKLTSLSVSIHADQPIIVRAKGHKFKFRYPKRIVYDKIVKLGLNVSKDEEKPKIKDKHIDVKAVAYILLHNPIKIFLFARIYTYILRWKYDSEVFSEIIEQGINPREIEAFYKSSISIMSLAQSKVAMLQL